MTSPTKVILLACGSFNPITNMHLRMMEIAKDALAHTGRYRVEEGIISPVSDNYKKQGLVSSEHRCSMIKLSLESSLWIRMDTWECEQPVWTVTQKVLSYHKSQQEKARSKSSSPKRRKVTHKDTSSSRNEDAVQVKLLCGADLLESFAVPGLWQDEDIKSIVRDFGLVCITRAGCNAEKFIYESDILTQYKENIHIVHEWIHNDISATKIRRAIRRGESVKYLIQDSVIDYVKENQLYGIPDNKDINYITPSPNRDEPPETATPVFPHIGCRVHQTEHGQETSDDAWYDVPPSPKQKHDIQNAAMAKVTSSGSSSAQSQSPQHNASISSSPQTPRRTICIPPHINRLVKRMREVRVAFAPETCV